jgi:PqqD family protein of HPr-rel-A system
MQQEGPAMDRMKRYRLDRRDSCRVCPLDDLVLLYHPRSGQTHMVISPVPEMLERMVDGAPVTASDLLDRLARDYDLGPRDVALAQVAAQLEALAALGLVCAA